MLHTIRFAYPTMRASWPSRRSRGSWRSGNTGRQWIGTRWNCRAASSDGEAPAEAAGRELLEETGYAAASIEVLGSMLPDTGRLSNRMWNCVANGVRRMDNRSPEPGIEVVTYTTADLARAITGGEFDHSLHVALLLQAMLRGVLRLP